MAGSKRSKGSFDTDDYYHDRGSSSKRVRFESNMDDSPADFEIDHEHVLETRKQRRGQVNTEELSDEEEVGGGVYSSDEEDRSDQENDTKGKGAAAGGMSDDFDIFAEDNTADKQPTPSSSNKKGKRKLQMNEIEGQELSSHDRDWDEDEEDQDEDMDGTKKREPKLMAFNMKQEMEEGSFDQEGNYHRNKADPEAYHDRWMEGVTRKQMAKAKEAQAQRERSEALKEAARQAEVPQTKTDVYKELVELLKPGENVREALGKLGNASTKKIPAWKQKLLEKKNRNKKQPTAGHAAPPALSEQEEADRQSKVEKITGLADQMMALGYFGVYDDTFELMVRHLRQSGAVPADWMPSGYQ
ncbi:hypothetical protein K492DRAFT_173144 [Lichtheimia hyalospora FSU 10163]|nr:hypothetical protein K492DRAFT_173144 [Lichtheimia hyalospora FSU 10163]